VTRHKPQDPATVEPNGSRPLMPMSGRWIYACPVEMDALPWILRPSETT
jgi:hypothetical protein